MEHISQSSLCQQKMLKNDHSFPAKIVLRLFAVILLFCSTLKARESPLFSQPGGKPVQPVTGLAGSPYTRSFSFVA
jgi:hypothetical protein